MNSDFFYQRLEQYNSAHHIPQKSLFIRILWYIINQTIVTPWWNVSNKLKIFCLRIFGAKIGKGVIIRPNVKIKYPWKLIIGDYCWIGESVIIDNLEWLIIEDRVCISQNVYLVNGNHDYKDSDFKYWGKKIFLGSEVWIGARSVIGPGVECGKGSVLSMGSVLTSNMIQKGVYSGNPAIFKCCRK